MRDTWRPSGWMVSSSVRRPWMWAIAAPALTASIYAARPPDVSCGGHRGCADRTCASRRHRDDQFFHDAPFYDSRGGSSRRSRFCAWRRADRASNTDMPCSTFIGTGRGAGRGSSRANSVISAATSPRRRGAENSGPRARTVNISPAVVPANAGTQYSRGRRTWHEWSPLSRRFRGTTPWWARGRVTGNVDGTAQGRNSTLEVSVVGLGGNNFGGRLDLADTRRVVHRALDLGVTLIDTADRTIPAPRRFARSGCSASGAAGGARHQVRWAADVRARSSAPRAVASCNSVEGACGGCAPIGSISTNCTRPDPRRRSRRRCADSTAGAAGQGPPYRLLQPDGAQIAEAQRTAQRQWPRAFASRLRTSTACWRAASSGSSCRP